MIRFSNDDNDKRWRNMIDADVTLECLREAVAEALERKRRLGHYSVQWIDGGPQLIGEDAPTGASPEAPPTRIQE
jgi:hypothetical protein